jgi:Na+/phosphate symporter
MMIDHADALTRLLISMPALLLLIGSIITWMRHKSWATLSCVVGSALMGIGGIAYGLRMISSGDAPFDVVVLQRWQSLVGIGDTWGVTIFAIGYLAKALRAPKCSEAGRPSKDS